jgi:hypothetical protein
MRRILDGRAEGRRRDRSHASGSPEHKHRAPVLPAGRRASGLRLPIAGAEVANNPVVISARYERRRPATGARYPAMVQARGLSGRQSRRASSGARWAQNTTENRARRSRGSRLQRSRSGRRRGADTRAHGPDALATPRRSAGGSRLRASRRLSAAPAGDGGSRSKERISQQSIRSPS